MRTVEGLCGFAGRVGFWGGVCESTLDSCSDEQTLGIMGLLDLLEASWAVLVESYS